MWGAAMRPAAAGRYFAASFREVALEATDSGGSSLEISAMALFARFPQGWTRCGITVETIDVFIQPWLSGRVGCRDMAVVTAVGQ